MPRRLQRPQAPCVGRRDIDHDEVGDMSYSFDRSDIVGDDRSDVFGGNRARLADRDADGDAERRASHPEAGSHSLRAFVREAQTIDERAVRGQPKQIGPRVFALGQRGDRSDLEVPEAERCERARAVRVLVEACGEADRRRKGQPHDGRREAGILRRARHASQHGAERRHMLGGPECREGQRMSRVRRQYEKERPQRAVHRVAQSLRRRSLDRVGNPVADRGRDRPHSGPRAPRLCYGQDSRRSGRSLCRRKEIFVVIIGVPKEIKTREYRVGMTPAGVRMLVSHGHRVLVETGAGDGSGIADADYAAQGATIVATAAEAWDAAMVVKVKEPLSTEHRYFRSGLVLYTYLHLAAEPVLTRALAASGVSSVAYETIEARDGSLPLLKPMSEVAGRMAVQVGATCLEKERGGKGVLLGGVPGTRRGRVVILGGGIVGRNAATIAVGMGAQVTVLDVRAESMASLEDLFGGAIETLYSNPTNVEEAVVRRGPRRRRRARHRRGGPKARNQEDRGPNGRRAA